MPKTALYVRVSTRGQTLENQIVELQSVCARNGWQIVRVFSDFGVSGAKGRATRPAHFDPNGITDGRDPLEQMILPLVVFEDTKYFDHGPNHRLTVEDAREWEKTDGPVPKR